MAGRIYGEDRFCTVPEWVLYAPVSDRAIRLYGILDRHADTEGRAFPGRRYLADKLHCSTSSVDRATDELERIGALTVLASYRPDGSQTVSDYTLRRTETSSPVRPPLLTGDEGGTHPCIAGSSPVTTQERESVNESQRTRQQQPTPPAVTDEPALLTETKPPASPSAAVSRVFDAWREATGKTGARLDPKRNRLIAKALKDYPEQDVLDAVAGWKNSAFHCGQNPSAKTYNGLDLLLRDAEHVEKFRDLARNGPENVHFIRPKDRQMIDHMTNKPARGVSTL